LLLKIPVNSTQGERASPAQQHRYFGAQARVEVKAPKLPPLAETIHCPASGMLPPAETVGKQEAEQA